VYDIIRFTMESENNGCMLFLLNVANLVLLFEHIENHAHRSVI